MKPMICLFAALSLVTGVGVGCAKKKSDPVAQVDTETATMQLANPDSVLGISYWVEDDVYAADVGAIPAGSMDMAGIWTLVQTGVPWFDTSVVPATATIVSVKLVLEVNAAPVGAAVVRACDLGLNPLAINPDDSAECEQVFADACDGNIYAEFAVDSSQSSMQISLGAQALSNLQSALSGGTGFGVGLRVPVATETNLVEVTFLNNAYLVVEYRE